MLECLASIDNAKRVGEKLRLPANWPGPPDETSENPAGNRPLSGREQHQTSARAIARAFASNVVERTANGTGYAPRNGAGKRPVPSVSRSRGHDRLGEVRRLSRREARPIATGGEETGQRSGPDGYRDDRMATRLIMPVNDRRRNSADGRANACANKRREPSVRVTLLSRLRFDWSSQRDEGKS